jgi:Protein of unknown function (DUF3047)
MKIPLIATVAALILIGSAAAGAGTKTGQDTPSSWKTLKVPGKPATEFRAVPNGAIKVSATESVGFLYRELPAAQNTINRLSWRWRVDMTPPATDQSMKGMDDRPLAIHICFDTDDAISSGESLLDRVGKWAGTSPLRGKVLTYVWGGTGKRGDLIENPYLNANGRIIILRPGNSPTGRCFPESVDIDADFEKAFGYSPPRARVIAISADTDDKRGTSMGAVANLNIHAE